MRRHGHKFENEKVTHKPKAKKLHPVRTLLRKFADGKISPEDAHNSLRHMGWPGAIVDAGRLALEQALRSPNIERSSEWLTKAATDFNLVLVQTGTKGDSITSRNGAIASLNIAQIPNYTSFIANNKLPVGHLAKRSLESTIECGSKIRNGINELSGIASQTNTVSDLYGVLAEVDVLALGQRYALNEHSDGSWYPLLAHHSDDHHDWRHNLASYAWDITVYTDLGENPEPSYKIQVKASDRAYKLDRIDYSDNDITEICIDPDLRVSGDSNVVGQIALELAFESSSYRRFNRNLDERTDQLLDLLG